MKGKVLPVKIFELVSEGQPPGDLAETLQLFAQGYQQYHAKNWAGALEFFTRAHEKTPTDEVSNLYIQRCQDYIAEPPGADWDGVYVMKTK